MTDALSILLRQAGLPASSDCLACEVCCRFPEAASPLAPFFCDDEISRAGTAGLGRNVFPPGTYGPGHAIILRRERSAFVCPALDVSSHACTIYAERPLDCRLYPFMLMYTPGGDGVVLGLDTYCPVMARHTDHAASAEGTGTGFAADVASLAAQLDGPLREAIVQRRGMVSDWKEHVRPLKTLPALSRALCGTDLGLARLVPSAQPALRPFFEAQEGRLCTHAFAALALWDGVFDLYWKVCGERLLIFAEGDGDCFLLTVPLGAGDAAGPAEEALYVMKQRCPGAPSPRLQDVDEPTRQLLVDDGWRVRDATVEYVYRRADLAGLRGNRYEKKRQMCNRFERERAWQWRAFSSDDFPAAVALHGQWLARRRERFPDPFYVAQAEVSFRCAYRALRAADALGLTVRVLWADDRLAGFTAGCPLHDGETFAVLFEVADLAVKGAAQFMSRRLCGELDGFPFINAGSASGLPNLARVKESYRPAHRLGAYVLVREAVEHERGPGP